MPIVKGISSVLTPDLLKVLAEMGHSDQIGISCQSYNYSI